MYDVRAVSLSLEGAFHGFNLAADPADAIQQLLLISDGVSHGYPK
jgi:hypothetical protein